MRTIAFFATLSVAAVSVAFPSVPKDSATALGVTRGKPFSSGLVFVNGKYLPPPYRVERRGTCLFISGQQVTGQIIGWNEFLKTQKGVKVTKSVEGESEVPSESVTEKVLADAGKAVRDAEVSLDELFEDAPKAEEPPRASASREARPQRPSVKVSYLLEGEFKPNAASQALLRKINADRTEVDRVLRTGGFVCFGESYARVTGDSRILNDMLEVLPELLQKSSDLEAFRASVRAKHLVYFGERLCEDLYRNRLDYPKLKARRKDLKGFDLDSL